MDEGEDHEVARWLEERRVDVGFVVRPDERFDTVPLVQDRLVALLPSAHTLAAKPAVSLAELCDRPLARLCQLFPLICLWPAVSPCLD